MVRIATVSSLRIILLSQASGLLTSWLKRAVTSSKAYDTIYVTKVGANTVTMHCKNVAVDFTKDFTVNVDEITYLSAELQKRLCVTGSEGNYTSTVGEFAGQSVQFGTAFDAGKVKVIQEIKEGKKR